VLNSIFRFNAVVRSFSHFDVHNSFYRFFRVGDIDQWGEVGQLFRVNNNKGQGQPSKIGKLPFP